MADDIKVTAGSGSDPAVATDEVGSRHFQIVKEAWGADGTANLVEDADGKRLPVKVGGTVATTTPAAGTATLTTPAMTTASATLLAANVNRLGAYVYNPLGADLLVRLGGDAAAAQIVRLPPRETWEVPPGYTGLVTGALVAGSGNANVTELTA